MLSRDVDSKLQLSAALALLECSRLLEWNRRRAIFTPVPHEAFEFSWRKDVHPTFGRLICWMNFSAGAELFAKAMCLAHGFEIRTSRNVPSFPQESDLAQWAETFIKTPKKPESVEVTNFGTLGTLLLPRKLGVPPVLQQLCDKAKATPSQRDLVLASYELLRSTIRNRDAARSSPTCAPRPPRDPRSRAPAGVRSGCRPSRRRARPCSTSGSSTATRWARSSCSIRPTSTGSRARSRAIGTWSFGRD